MLKKSLAVLGAAGAMVAGAAAPALASNTDATTSVRGGSASAPERSNTIYQRVCGPGRHYCTTFVYDRVPGGIFLYRTQSVGFAAGSGCAREYVVVNGSYTRPTNLVCYGFNTRLTARHPIGAKAFCGTVIRTDWVGRNAPQGAPGIVVTC